MCQQPASAFCGAGFFLGMMSAIGQDGWLSGKGLRKFAAMPTPTVAFRHGCGDDLGSPGCRVGQFSRRADGRIKVRADGIEQVFQGRAV